MFHDSKLCFGAKLAPAIFNRISQAVRRMLLRRGILATVYLDDFLLIAPSFAQCIQALNTTISLLSRLGFYIAWEKIEGPAQRLTFLGVLIDSVAMRLELPQDKLLDLSSMLNTVANRRHISKRLLDRLIGKLSWAARVVHGGRTFVRRLIDTSLRLTRPSHRVAMHGSFMDDISFWRNFMAHFNGKALLIQRRETDLSTDACPVAWGSVYHGDWAYGTWAADMPEADSLSINHKEVLALLFAARRWRLAWRGAHVVWHTDNLCAAAWVNRGSCRSPLIMKGLRELFWLSATNDFQITARYLSGAENWASDSVSRLHEPAKHRKWLPDCPLPIPLYLAAKHMSCASYSDLCFRLSTANGPMETAASRLTRRSHKTSLCNLSKTLPKILPGNECASDPSLSNSCVPLYRFPNAVPNVCIYPAIPHNCQSFAQRVGAAEPHPGLLGYNDTSRLSGFPWHGPKAKASNFAANTVTAAHAFGLVSAVPNSSLGGHFARLVGSSSKSELNCAGTVRSRQTPLSRRLSSLKEGHMCDNQADKDNAFSGANPVRICSQTSQGDPLCPVIAIVAAFRQSPFRDPRQPAFVGRVRRSQQTHALSRIEFDSQFSQLLVKAGLDKKLYSVHSLRRGGATFAKTAGVSTEMVQLLGDWRSDAYCWYIDLSGERRAAAELMAKAVSASSPN